MMITKPNCLRTHWTGTDEWLAKRADALKAEREREAAKSRHFASHGKARDAGCPFCAPTRKYTFRWCVPWSRPLDGQWHTIEISASSYDEALAEAERQGMNPYLAEGAVMIDGEEYELLTNGIADKGLIGRLGV